MSQVGGISSDQLKQFIERIENLEQEKANIAEDIREVYAEAKYNGFDPKIMRSVLKIRKMDSSEREEHEYILDTYLIALGMAVEKAAPKAPSNANESEEAA